MEGAAPQRLTEEGHKLYRIRQTCMKMLDKRGYNVLQEHISMSSEKFRMEFGPDPKREDMTLLVEKVSRYRTTCSRAQCSSTPGRILYLVLLGYLAFVNTGGIPLGGGLFRFWFFST